MALTTARGDGLTSINASNISSGTLSTDRYVQGGIKQADQWRLTANITGTNADITANLSQEANKIVGTGMSQTSGIFTFPETGIYLIISRPEWSGIDANDNVFCSTWETTNNSDYTRIDRPAYSNKDGGVALNESMSIGISYVDVTNTTNVKVKFQTESMGSSSVLFGNTSYIATNFSFIRLGDT